jgi:hypothetical protein
MIHEVVIRESREADAFSVEKVRIGCWQKHFWGIIDSDFLSTLDPLESYKRRQEAIAAKHHINLVAEKNGIIVGLSDAGASRAGKNPHEGEI